MSGLLFLTAEDFGVQKGTKGDILCNNVPGFSLILFYSTHCKFCQTLIPIFKRLPGTIGGCQFGMVNVSSNRQIVEMSESTISPIKYVPYIVLHVNGKPFMSYKGPSDEGEIRRFVMEVAGNLQKKQQFSKERVKEPSSTGIPEYTIGIPISGGKNDAVCWLTFNEAYTPKTA
jgi:hypothetical protein